MESVVRSLVDQCDKNTKEIISRTKPKSKMYLVGKQDSRYLRGVMAKARKIGIPEMVEWATPDEYYRMGCYLFDRETTSAYWDVVDMNDIDSMSGVNNLLPMSCTAEAVRRIIKQIKRHDGEHVAIIGRGHAVKGLCNALIKDSYTVTVCHSKTPDLFRATAISDIIVNGSPGVPFKSVRCTFGAVVIDISGSMRDAQEVEFIRYISSEDVGRLNLSILMNRYCYWFGVPVRRNN